MLAPGKSTVALLLAALSLAIWVPGCRRSPAASATPLPPKVNVGQPTVRELTDEDEYNGFLESSSVVEVRSRVRGHIQKLHFQDGDNVVVGQLLFELDPRPFQVQVDQALAYGRALEAQKLAAEKDVARYQELIRSGAASKQELEKAQADAASYDAQISAKMEEVRQHQLDLEYSQIKAPITGRVSRAELTEGNLVNAGGSDPLLTTIVATDPMYVYFSVDERSLQRYMKARQADQPVRQQKVPFRFALDSDEGFPREGVLDFADNRVDADTGTIQMRGVVENKEGLLVSGSRVRVRLPVSKPYSAVVVPDTAILSDQNRRYVLVVDSQNIVSRRDVTLGRLLADSMQVILPDDSGVPAVSPDEWIIVQGLQRARINYEVERVEPDQKPLP
ncbi:MAG: efflux RND transporter periplasmic adaptor subunit [Planctomycetaceae bacterium]|nr:efflux RND transporter periplasmic adaptor subunit [Planctomycetaceae bacterium]